MIHWSNVVPHHLAASPGLSASSIWAQEMSFEQGKTYGIVAPSGTGKSSVVQILGLADTTGYTGTVALGGKDISRASRSSVAAWQRESIAVVWQDLRLIPSLTGQDNIRLRSQLSKLVAWQEIESWANRLAISSVWHRPVHQLSYGERQRVAILRALAGPFQFLVLDEPFGHLDPENRTRAADLIQDVCASRGLGYIITMLTDDSSETPGTSLPCELYLKL